MSSESSAEEALTTSPASTVPLAPSARTTHPPRQPIQGEGDTDTNANAQANKKKRKAPQTADDTEHPKIPTSKRQKKNKPEEGPTEPEKNKKKDKKVRIAEQDDEERLDVGEGQRGADPPNTQAVDANDNARYGIINEERLSTLDLDTEENVPFTDADLTRARQGHDQQGVECFFRQLTGPAADVARIAEMRLEYIRPYTVTNELWAVWPELSLTMRLNLIEGLMEVEISKVTRKLRREAARLWQELERAQVIMRDPRRWGGGDDEPEKKRTRGPRQTSAAQSKKRIEMPKDPDTGGWTSEDDERMRDLLERKETDSPDAVEKFKEVFDERPEWREDERRFCLEFTKARNNLRLEGDGQWKIGSDAMRALSRAHRERFANTHPGKGDDPNKLGIYRPPLAIVKKFCKDTEFRTLWKIREKKVANTKGDGTGKATAPKIGKQSDDDKEDQQQDVDMDVDMEDEHHYDSDGNTISASETDHGGSRRPSVEASDQRDVHDNASQPGDDEDSSDDESSESDSDSEDHDQRRMAKGKERADRNAEKKRQKEREAETKRLEEEVAEAERKKEDEEHKKMVEEIEAFAERKRSLKNGGKVFPKKKTTERVNVVEERKGVGRKGTKDVSEDEGGSEEEELEEISDQEQDEEDEDKYEDR